MTISQASADRLLSFAQVAITNVLNDPDLHAALAAFGYDDNRLRQGNILRENLRTFYQQQKGAYGDLYTAGDELADAQQQAHETYMRYLKVARVALEGDRGAREKLALKGERKRTLAGWLEQAQQFYSNALSDPNILNKLAEYNITSAMLETGKRQVDLVGSHNAARKQRKGTARDATRMRIEAKVALDEWMSDFLKIARVALKDRPQLLEQLGIAPPATRAARTSASSVRAATLAAADGATLAPEG